MTKSSYNSNTTKSPESAVLWAFLAFFCGGLDRRLVTVFYSVYPFANIVRNNICHNGNRKGYKYLNQAMHLPFVPI